MRFSAVTRFARIVSYVFDGSVLALPIFLAVCFYGPSGSIQFQMLPSFFVSYFFIAVIPYSFILYLYTKGKISDLQIPKRSQRLLPLLVINVSVIAGFVILLFLQSTVLLKTVYLIYLLGLPVISIITVFYKISFHASYITIFSFIYIIIFGRWAIATILLVPLVGWSRIRLKRHTTGQVLLGIAVMFALSSTLFYLNGFLGKNYLVVNELRDFISSIVFYLKPGLPLYGSENPLIIILIFLLFFFLLSHRQSLHSRDFIISENNETLERQDQTVF